MRIAVDARELVGRPTGVGRYLSQLLDRWADSPDARRHQWALFAHTRVAGPQRLGHTLTVLPGSGNSRWEQWTLPRALGQSKPDILFAPGYTAPLTAPCATVVSIHDMSFAAHPEWFSWREGLRRRTLTAWSARRARIVLTDSQFSHDEIVKYIGVPAGKVKVIPLGGIGLQRSGSGLQQREPLVLYVGSIFRRRHIDTLIDAFVRFVAPAVADSRLEIVGDNRLYPPADPADALAGIDAAIARRVTLRSYVDDETLHDLYRRASVFAFLSDYEGFGLTPLEALGAGVPPLVLDTPVAREIYGPAARYVAEPSREAIGAALSALLTSRPERERLLSHADEVLARYDWGRTAAMTLSAMEEAAGA